MLLDEIRRTGRRDMMLGLAAARRRFTRSEYHRMGEVGILTRAERVELIRGEIITMSPHGSLPLPGSGPAAAAEMPRLRVA
jgi:hypothetical protein